VFDLGYLNRADYEKRWQGNSLARFAGVLTTNEIREMEGFDQHADGDTLNPPVTTTVSGGTTVKPSDKLPQAA
jgi:hypothetical protein